MKGLPRDILECSERVLDYHRLSKIDERTRTIPPDPATRVPPHRVFDYAPQRTPLETKLRDVTTPVMSLLMQGLEAVPSDHHGPRQDLRTLSTWLYLAAGLREKRAYPWGHEYQRPYPSADATYPVEIYVAAFAIDGVTPGLHHYCPREHALRKLRDGPETLSLLRRGRPDLHFLGTVPGALLVTSVFCRAGWTQGRRGYRQALIDTGHAVENCHTVAVGLGMNTHTRLRMNDSCMRELLGLPEDFDYVSAEAVQGFVVWADTAERPMEATAHSPPTRKLELLPRAHSGECVSYGTVLAVHLDTLARGVAGRDVRPPLTELTPLPLESENRRSEDASKVPLSAALSAVLMKADPDATAFADSPIARDTLAAVSRAGFRGGTYFPFKAEGPHAATIRAFWVVHNVTDQPAGVWWHDCFTDQWSMRNEGPFRETSASLTRYRRFLEQAAAVCVMVADLRTLLRDGGPDLYRLAYLEAGVVAQRMKLSAASLNLAHASMGDFLDDAWREFLGLSGTGWEPVLVCALGNPPTA